MLGCPFGIRYFCLIDFLKKFAFCFNRDGEPFDPVYGLDLVAVAPVTAGVLHLVVENKFIYHIDNIEISLPGNIVRLRE